MNNGMVFCNAEMNIKQYDYYIIIGFVLKTMIQDVILFGKSDIFRQSVKK